jgi:hypothetical protein
MTHESLELMERDHETYVFADDTEPLGAAAGGDSVTGSPPMIGRCLSIPEWLAYVAAYPWGPIRPTRLVLHHTYRPDETTWRGLASMRGMQDFYASKGWRAAPHIYTAPDGTWLFFPMDKPGIHAGTGNCNIEYQRPVWGQGKLEWYSIGVEMVGFFDQKRPGGAVWNNTLAVLGGLCAALDIPVERIDFHRDYTNEKTCPGAAVTKPWVRDEVSRWLAQHAPRPVETPYRTRYFTSILETPGGDGVQVAWHGRAVIPPGQVISLRDTEHPGWLHWNAAGFIEAAIMEPVTAPPVLPPTPPAPWTSYTEDSPIMDAPPVDLPNLVAAFNARCARSPYAREEPNPLTLISSDSDVRKHGIVQRYVALCAAWGIDVYLALAQCAKETGNLVASLAQRRDRHGNNLRNPAGIGVNGDVSPGPAPGFVWDADRNQYRRCVGFADWATGAIPAHLGRLLAYATKPDERTPEQQQAVDYALAFRDLPTDMHGSAPTLKPLGQVHNPTGRGWAKPGDDYGQGIAEIATLLRRAAGGR